MSLPPGAFITTLNGARCTAIPKSKTVNTSTTTTTTEAAAATTTTTPPPPPPPAVNTALAGGFTTTTTTTTTTSAPPASSTTISTLLSSSLTSSTSSTSLTAPDSFQTIVGQSTVDSSTTNGVAEASAAASQAQSEATGAPSPADATGQDSNGADIPATATGIANGFASGSPLLTGPGSQAAATGKPNVSSSSPSGRPLSSTVAVAGGVVGGVAVISLIAVLLWFWRRRHLKNRRSTLLTPLSVTNDPSSRGREKAFDFNQGGFGPTAWLGRAKAAVAASLSNTKSRMGQLRRGRDNDDGNSEPVEATAVAAISPSDDETGSSSLMGRLVNWWNDRNDKTTGTGIGSANSKPPGAGGFGFKVPNRLKNWRRLDDDEGDDVGAVAAQAGPTTEVDRERAIARAMRGSAPDFLTLLGMDDRELDREAQRRRVSRNQGGSASAEGFLGGGLGLNFESIDGSGDPFSDINAISRADGPADAPKAYPASWKPFPNAVKRKPDARQQQQQQQQRRLSSAPKPATYVADIRRSRGLSASAAPSRAPSGMFGGGPGGGMATRDSVATMSSFATQRNKFRSDPFDLDRLDLLAQSPPAMPSIAVLPRGVGPQSGRYSRSSSMAATAGVRSSAGNASSRRTPSGASSMALPVQRPEGGLARGSSSATRGRPASGGAASSKYSSGVSAISAVSMGDWSDPGPDVGPSGGGGGGGRGGGAAAAWDGPVPRESPTQGWRNAQEREKAIQEAAAAAGGAKRRSGMSQESVGKAL